MVYRFDSRVTVITHTDCLHKWTPVFAHAVASLALGPLVSFRI